MAVTKRGNRVFAVLATTVLLAALGSCTDMMTNNPNREPVVSISPASYTIYPGDAVTFDAGASTDPDDQELDVTWEVISAPGDSSTYFLDGASSFAPTFNSYFRNLPGESASDRYSVGPEDYSVPPYLGDYTLRMTISDEYGVQRTGTVDVTVTNSAPGADAGVNSIGAIAPAATATPVALVLTGTGGELEESSRRNTWQYRWSVTDQPAGSDLSLTNTAWTDPSDPAAANTAVADFTPLTSGSDAKPGEGVYAFRLEVRDEYGATSSDSMIVATSGNTAPGLVMPNTANVTVTNGGSLDGDGSSGSPFSNSDHGTTGNNYAISIEYTDTEITNAEDDTMTVTWEVEALRGAFDEIRLGIDSEDDRYYGIGATIETQTGVVDGFTLNIAPAGDLDAFRDNGTVTTASSAAPDTTWDVAIRVIANDGAVSAATADQPVIYLDLYTVP